MHIIINLQRIHTRGSYNSIKFILNYVLNHKRQLKLNDTSIYWSPERSLKLILSNYKNHMCICVADWWLCAYNICWWSSEVEKCCDMIQIKRVALTVNEEKQFRNKKKVHNTPRKNSKTGSFQNRKSAFRTAVHLKMDWDTEAVSPLT
jgi:hypothetical protein